MKTTIASVLTAMLAVTSFAESTPVMVSLVTPVQVPSRNYDVTGFRLSLLYGDCKDFAGLDIGIVPHTTGDFSGLAIGGVNMAGGQFYGGQIGLMNRNSFSSTEWGGRSIGAQIGLVNCSDSFCGHQSGFLNTSKTSFVGWQSGLVNLASDLRGLQSGLVWWFAVNVADGNVDGVQIGLVNFANTMENGVQIGLVNIIAHNGWFPVLPIINGNF